MNSQFKHRTKWLLALRNVTSRIGESIAIATDSSLATVSVALKNALILGNKSNKACNVAENYVPVLRAQIFFK